MILLRIYLIRVNVMIMQYVVQVHVWSSYLAWRAIALIMLMTISVHCSGHILRSILIRAANQNGSNYDEFWV